MTDLTDTQYKELIACFTELGFTLDFNVVKSKSYTDGDKRFADDLYKKYLDNHHMMLFYYGFMEEPKKMNVSMRFLHSISSKFINSLSKTPTIELECEQIVITLTSDEIEAILDNVPYMIGQEFLNKRLIKKIYKSLSEVFSKEIGAYTGTVAEYLLEHNSNFNVVGRVFFHLVENKSDTYPFAFLATYSTDGDGDHQSMKIKQLNLAKWIPVEHFFISGKIGHAKPKQEVFHYIEKNLQLDKTKTVYIGDSFENDIVGAKEAGWHAIWMNHRKRNAPVSTVKPDHTVHHGKELLDLFREE